MVALTGQSLGLHRAGGLRILAVTSARPLKAAPSLPTVAQADFRRLEYSSYGLLAPAGTPKPITEKVAQATRGLLSQPDYELLITDAGLKRRRIKPGGIPQSYRGRCRVMDPAR